MQISTLPRLKRVYGCAPCMEKLDRLEWTEGIAFTCHGARIGIRVNNPSILERIPGHLPPGSKESCSPTVDSLYSLYVGGESGRPNVCNYNLLYAGSARIARTMELDKLFDTLESTLHFNVAVGARRRIFVHAGVVGWRGRAIVIPGRSMSGKTTLVAELVRAGAIYYSDEFAAFDSYGRVHPYARPLMVREEEAKERQKRCPVESLGGCVGTKPLPVGLVAVTAFKAGTQWRPRVLTPGQALLALMDNTVLARLRPGTALKFLQPVALGATVLKGRRGEARDIAERLLNEMEKSMPNLPGSGREKRTIQENSLLTQDCVFSGGLTERPLS
jgi:hypothetical protein